MTQRKITDYKVIQKKVDTFNQAPLEIAEQVRKEIENGWEPYGEMRSSNGFCYQVIVKYAEKTWKKTEDGKRILSY